MTKRAFKNRRVRDVVTFWPPSSWTSSYAGADPLTPRLSKARIVAVRGRKQGVSLQVEDGGRLFSTVLIIEDAESVSDLVTTLDRAKGLSLEDAGDLRLCEEGS
jgi:hypothetical protein